MKNLKDVYEKLDIDKVNLKGDFPLDSSLEAICQYLLDAGFEPIPPPPGDPEYRNIESFSHIVAFKGKGFIRCKGFKNFGWIRFGDTSKPVTKKNPIFFISDDKRYFIEFILNSRGNEMYIPDGDYFVELINKTFKL